MIFEKKSGSDLGNPDSDPIFEKKPDPDPYPDPIFEKSQDQVNIIDNLILQNHFRSINTVRKVQF